MEKISVNHERDSALRLTEVQIINRDREGNEAQGIIVCCHDSGRITVGEVIEWQSFPREFSEDQLRRVEGGD